MVDEANIPTHRYYKPENNIPLRPDEVSKTVIKASAITKIDAHIAVLATTRLQAALFGSSEIGFMFTPQDITTLYQDRAGTTPVTAAGQSVGLRLDKSQGLRQGPELVTNGDFSAGSTGWAVPAGWSISSGTAVASVTNASLLSGSNVTAGRSYRVEFDVVSYTSGTLYVRVGAGAAATTSSSGRKSFILTATTTAGVEFYGGAITATIDNISVRELAGNHQVAVSDAKRGVYGWMPKTGRRNLLVYSGFDGAVSGTPGTTPTGWTRFLGTTGGTSTYAPNSALLGGGSLRIQATADRHQLGQVVPVAANTSYIISVDCDVVSGTILSTYIDWVAPPSGATTTYRIDGVSVPSNTIVPTGMHKFEAILSVGATAGNGNARIGVGIQANNTGDITFSNPQLELGSTATAYQRVVSRYDITEAGVPTCYYVQADGVDDAYVTPTITPNTDKVQVFAGVRKLSDAATQIVVELSASSANDGSFNVASSTLAGAVYGFNSRGTVAQGATSPATFAAPISSVLTGLGDISGDSATLRVNGTQVSQSTTDQGTGGYNANPAYLYARGGTTLPFNGLDFGHAVRFGPNLDAATIARVESLIARNTPEVTL